jgi:hypothetical protein
MSVSASNFPRSRHDLRLAWVERLNRFAHAGQTTATFCAAEGISVASFYAWKRRLAAELLDPAATTAPMRLLPVHVGRATSPVELLLPSGATLRLGPGCDLAFVRSLLATLGVVPC